MGKRDRERKELIQQGREDDLRYPRGRPSKVHVDDGGWDPFRPPPFIRPHAPLTREDAEAIFIGEEPGPKLGRLE